MDTWVIILTISTVCPSLVAVIVLLNAWDRRIARQLRRRPAALDPETESTEWWNIALLVDADATSGILRPTVQFLEPRLPPSITVGVHLNTRRGEPILGTARRFANPTAGTDLVMGSIYTPDDASFARATTGTWTVVFSHEGTEIARRSSRLVPAVALNAEAEIEAPDFEIERKPDRLPRTHLAPVRHLGETLACALAACIFMVVGDLAALSSLWLLPPAVVLIGVAGTFAYAASLKLFVTCPRCGHVTGVLGRRARQQCEICERPFILVPCAS
jgi:hypothetical protein